MEVIDIQALLNKKVADKAAEDFKAARIAAEKILAPFFEPAKVTSEETVAKISTEFKAGASVSRYGYVHICDNMEVPEAYVRKMQAEASKEFIDKVEELQAQVEDLYNQVN